MFTYPEAPNLHQRIIRGSEDQKRYERNGGFSSIQEFELNRRPTNSPTETRHEFYDHVQWAEKNH